MTPKASPTQNDRSPLILGIDLGTSGIRGALIDTQTRQPIAFYAVPLALPIRNANTSEQSPELWLEGFELLLRKIQNAQQTAFIEHIILDATSSTVCLVNADYQPVSMALMYDDKRATAEAQLIAKIAPRNSGAHGASSTLAKVMWLYENTPHSESFFVCHQIDFINVFLTGLPQITDANNALKMGFDPINMVWPDWISQLLPTITLPKVVLPGDFLGQIQPGLVEKYGFSSKTKVYAGTTDSIAAFLASGAHQLGDAVTSLGSTLALKLITEKPIFAPEYGIYSHRLKNQWLVGGASNTGGAVLLKHFDLEALIEHLKKIPERPQNTHLDYYPLLCQGERFPISDPCFQGNLDPIPDNPETFLLGLIEGLVSVEKLGYQRLTELGASPVTRIFTAGGGLKNRVWMTLRSQELSAPVLQSLHTEAAFGVTQLLEIQSFNDQT
ncbi:FGGY-family carbohydrate kinase [Thiosulfativibrio zosterae]|nr:FGGY-family carbohydrate kinase [Thiosulfativibrio zosterae]